MTDLSKYWQYFQDGTRQLSMHPISYIKESLTDLVKSISFKDIAKDYWDIIPFVSTGYLMGLAMVSGDKNTPISSDLTRNLYVSLYGIPHFIGIFYIVKDVIRRYIHSSPKDEVQQQRKYYIKLSKFVRDHFAAEMAALFAMDTHNPHHISIGLPDLLYVFQILAIIYSNKNYLREKQLIQAESSKLEDALEPEKNIPV